MSVCRKLPDGTIQKIAGHTILLDANASEVREGQVSFTNPTWGAWVDVTFTDPMPDTGYKVILEYPTQGQSWDSNSTPADVGIYNKTTTGFRITMWPVGTVSKVYIYWTAFKLIKLEGYTALQNKVENPDDTPTIDSMNLVTSDGVARAIENASAVWKGTKAEWNALPATDKVKYDLAVLLDQTLVKAIDRTDGTETNVADLSGQFVGTHAEWEAETDKTQYKTAVLTDDRKTVNEVTGTGALNEVADDARIWRGTKAEWEAMSAAEKDEWDQAEIETIEAQGLNPFRTLSDPEELSISPNTDYTCPHDGFINIATPSNDGCTVYINGKVWGTSTYTVGGYRNSHTVPVQQGDVFKYNGNGSIVTARWYTTDINPGNPIDYPVVHRSQSLDWDNAVYPTNAEMLAGWTAQSDGFFIDYSIPTSNSSNYLTINDLIISSANYGTSGNWSTHGVQIPVVKGDVLKHTSSMQPWTNPVIFVPYKDYPDYSTTEHWTGKRWIDGKKIYSKVLVSTSNVTAPNNGWATAAWTASPGIDKDIRIDIEPTSNYKRIDIYRDGTTFKILGVLSPIGISAGTFLIHEYTKTTDD